MESVWFLFWWCPVLSVDCFHKLCLSGTPSKDCQVGWDLGNRMVRGYWFYAKRVCPMGSYAWGIEVFCSKNEMVPHFSNRAEHLNTSDKTSHGTDSVRIKPITPGRAIPKISTRLTIFWGSTWKTEFVERIHMQQRTSLEEKSDGLHKKCSIELWTILMFKLLLCYHTAAYSSTVHATNIVSITEKV